jgi:hypothetical protein
VDLFFQDSGQPPISVGHPHIALKVPARQLLSWREKLEGHGVATEGPYNSDRPDRRPCTSMTHLETTWSLRAWAIRKPFRSGLRFLSA